MKQTVALLVLITAMFMTACGAPDQERAEEPAQEASPTDQASLDAGPVLKVICHEDGSTELLGDAVETSPEGVRIQVDNRAGEFASLNGTGIDFSEGVTEEAAQVPPGGMKIACWPGSMHRGPEPKRLPVVVIDPAEHWQPGELECAEDSLVANQISDYAADSPGIKGDPIDIVREHATGLKDGDELISIGYPKASYGRKVGIQRNDGIVAIVGLTPTDQNGWLIGGVSTCDGSGIHL